VTAGLAAAAVTGAAPVEAARVRTVTKYVVVKYTYDPATGVTRVTKRRATKVTAKFVGKKVFEKKRGAWVRVPYVWDRDKHALVYSRKLHLRLLADKRAAGRDGSSAQDPATQPGTPAAPEQPPATNPPEYPGDPVVTLATPYALADAAHHVLNRVGYGVSRQGLRDVADAGGARAWLRQQLQPDGIGDSACQDYLQRLPDQSDAIWQVADDLRNDRRDGWRELQWINTGMIVRAAWSRRQLLASLEEFWGNHFNVTVPHDGVAASRAHYQHTIRTHALGRFEDLLVAASTHPAMLTYLNNRNSDDEHPNENQGRELLELHTLGLGAGYTEEDVLNSARILTGLSVDGESEEFEYKPWRHWTGPVRVLGFSHANATPAGGLDVFRQYARYLATHPSTARRVSTKLARWFVSDAPTPAYVDALAAVYQRSDGRVSALLEHIFSTPEFWTAGAKTRRPFDALMAAIRRLGVTPTSGIDGLNDLTWVVAETGQPPFGAPYPTGWPDAPQAWASTVSTLNRWNYTLGLSDGWWDGLTTPDLRADIFGDTLPTTHGEALDVIGRRLFGIVPAASHKQALLTFLGRSATSPANANSAIYGWRLPYVVALLLDSPYLVSR
jgi:uncharacterized protein (DUF1800 family)